MKYFLILLFFLPVIIIAIYLVRTHFSRLQKAKILLKKYGSEISDSEKYELDRDLFSSKYIKLWPRQIVGLNVRNVVRLDSKRILGDVFLRYGDRRSSLLEGDVVTIFCVNSDKKDIMPETSSVVFSNSSIQIWPFEDKVIFVAGFIDNEDEMNLFIKKCDSILL